MFVFDFAEYRAAGRRYETPPSTERRNIAN